MKTVKVRLNHTVEYEVTLNLMDYYNDNQILNLALALENEDLDRMSQLGECKMISYYNDMIDWDYAKEEMAS